MEISTLEGSVSKAVLDNGIRVVCEHIPHMNSVSIGVYLNTGTRYENQTNNGICHFLEHLAFKGTDRRTHIQIAKDMDSIGGEFDAFTSHESTCFSATVLGKDLPFALDLISDLVVHSNFPAPEVIKERGVVLEEIRTVEDDPEEFVNDLLYEIMFARHPLGKPILGTKETVGEFEREHIVEFRDSTYTGDNLVLAAAGDIEFTDLLSLAENYFSKIPIKSNIERNFFQPEISSHTQVIKREFEQVHFCFGTLGLPITSEDRFAGYLLNNILGGNFSSRLFQKIREEHGLCYSIYSYLNCHTDTGLLGVYGATALKTFPFVIDLMMGEMEQIQKEPVAKDELERVKNQFRGNLILSLEDSAHRMSQLAKQEIYFDQFISLAEVIEEVNRVTLEQIQKLANELIDEKFYNLVVMGDISKTEGLDLQIPMG